jgi:ABC-type Fe3+-hydroxamate transport system substrate-binding protein
MIKSTDQMNRTIRLEVIPRRIVSLVPSQTELLYDLGLEDEVVGITKFCIHPDVWFQQKQRVGGTKNVQIEKVRTLQPDLIIGNKEENTQADIEQLEEIAPVWMSDIDTLEQSIEMILEIGKITNRALESEHLVQSIQSNFKLLKQHITKEWTCLYFMWKDPYFTVGKHTFIDAMIQECGGTNLQTQSRYPEWDFSLPISPDVILLSSEPYPFNESHLPFFQEKYPDSKVMLVDGEYFSWYGSRLEKAPVYFSEILKEILKGK